mgnify:CR=1 FL=1
MGMWDGNLAPPGGQQNHQMNPQFNSNMSNNQQPPMQQQAPPPQQQMPPMDKHNPVGSWQRGGWDSGIQSGKRF